jgi:hypothetical protein
MLLAACFTLPLVACDDDSESTDAAVVVEDAAIGGEDAGMTAMDAGMEMDGAMAMEGIASDSGTYQLHLVDGDWTPAMGSNSLRVHLMGAEGHAMAMDLAVEPWMPEHGHGSSAVPTATDEGHGTWNLENILFTMPGAWELRITCTIAGVAERFVVAVDVL